MLFDKNTLVSDIKRLSNLLDEQYGAELNFRNHCYLRIAYDNTVQDQWDYKMQRPFTKFASEDQLRSAVQLLNTYLIDKHKLLNDNQNSLAYRKRAD